MIINGKEEKLALNYPCNWSYRIICEKNHDPSRIITEVIANRPHSYKEGNQSKGGAYQSYHLELLVHHEEDRQGIFELFKQHPHIKMVL